MFWSDVYGFDMSRLARLTRGQPIVHRQDLFTICSDRYEFKVRARTATTPPCVVGCVWLFLPFICVRAYRRACVCVVVSVFLCLSVHAVTSPRAVVRPRHRRVRGPGLHGAVPHGACRACAQSEPAPGVRAQAQPHTLRRLP